jgi:hypothetical protein
VAWEIVDQDGRHVKGPFKGLLAGRRAEAKADEMTKKTDHTKPFFPQKIEKGRHTK